MVRVKTRPSITTAQIAFAVPYIPNSEFEGATPTRVAWSLTLRFWSGSQATAAQTIAMSVELLQVAAPHPSLHLGFTFVTPPLYKRELTSVLKRRNSAPEPELA